MRKCEGRIQGRVASFDRDQEEGKQRPLSLSMFFLPPTAAAPTISPPFCRICNTPRAPLHCNLGRSLDRWRAAPSLRLPPSLVPPSLSKCFCFCRERKENGNNERERERDEEWRARARVRTRTPFRSIYIAAAAAPPPPPSGLPPASLTLRVAPF